MKEKLIPHPHLKEYYPEETRRREFVDDTFNKTASRYDRINQILSLGSGKWYRRQALLRAGLHLNMKVLDVATGTGLVAESERALVGTEGKVVGLDRSPKMLAEVRKKIRIPLVQADAIALPFASNTFDFLSMGYALRHVEDLHTTFEEYIRVLKPGGILLILELMRPQNKMMYRLIRGYFKAIIGLISSPGISGAEGAQLIRYYWDTIDQFVDTTTLESALNNTGFLQVKHYRMCDFFTEITAIKP